MKTNSKKYTIELRDEEGSVSLHRTNDGFSALELLSLLTMCQHDVLDQLKGVSEGEIDTVKRTFMERDGDEQTL